MTGPETTFRPAVDIYSLFSAVKQEIRKKKGAEANVLAEVRDAFAVAGFSRRIPAEEYIVSTGRRKGQKRGKAQIATAGWRREYDSAHPHSSTEDMFPTTMAKRNVQLDYRRVVVYDTPEGVQVIGKGVVPPNTAFCKPIVAVTHLRVSEVPTVYVALRTVGGGQYTRKMYILRFYHDHSNLVSIEEAARFHSLYIPNSQPITIACRKTDFSLQGDGPPVLTHAVRTYLPDLSAIAFQPYRSPAGPACYIYRSHPSVPIPDKLFEYILPSLCVATGGDVRLQPTIDVIQQVVQNQAQIEAFGIKVVHIRPLNESSYLRIFKPDDLQTQTDPILVARLAHAFRGNPRDLEKHKTIYGPTYEEIDRFI